MKKDRKKTNEKFGYIKNNSYLCIVIKNQSY